MIPKRNSDLTSNARALRREMTKAEKHLWYDFLSRYTVRFQRQKVLGRYIADFYCADAKLVVEVDGPDHDEPQEKDYDQRRTAFLRQTYGLEIMRVGNYDVLYHFKETCDAIHVTVQKRLGNPID